MFSTIAILTFVIPLVSALTLQLPKDPVTGSSTVITWTSDAGDPPTFTIELLQDSFHNSIAVANNVPTQESSLTLQLPSVPPGSGYTLQAVANNNISQIYSTTGDFTIGALSASGSTSVSVAQSSAKSTSSSSSIKIPTTAPGSTTGFGVTASAPSSSISSTPAGSSAGTPTAAAAATTTSAPTFHANAASPLKLNFKTGSTAVLLLSALAGVAILAL